VGQKLRSRLRTAHRCAKSVPFEGLDYGDSRRAGSHFYGFMLGGAEFDRLVLCAQVLEPALERRRNMLTKGYGLW